MAVTTAKKPARLDDMPQTKEMLARPKTLREREAALRADVDAASRRRYSEYQRRLDARAEALAAGRPEPTWPDAADARDTANSEELAVVSAAIGKANRQLHEIHEAESRRILDQTLSERRKLVTGQRDALVALRDALARRREHIDVLGNQGVHVNLVEWPCALPEQNIEESLAWLDQRLVDHFQPTRR